MLWLSFLFIVFACVNIILDAIAFWKIRQETGKELSEFPLVSVLLAVRNEEKNILPCLESLAKLSYPKLEILIGDDNSTDNSLNIVQNFIQNKPQFAVFPIRNRVGNAIAKANVLAQLAHLAQGEWLLITDADVEVPPRWVENMLAFAGQASIVTGFTWVKGKGIGAILQALDWTFALGIAKVFSYWSIPVTAMGNNMGVRKDAYLQTGGYEHLPPTLVEDFTLFKDLVIKQKHHFVQIFDTSVMATTQAVGSLKDFFQQRKRWIQGASKAHWLTQCYLGCKVGFYPIFLAVVLLQSPFNLPSIGIWYALKLLMQTLALYKFLYLLGKSRFIWAFGLYELYGLVLSLVLPIYSLLPLKNTWKGRIFEKNTLQK